MPIDPTAFVATTARVHPAASIGPRVTIGDFCVIEEDVSIGADCSLEPHVYVKRWTTMGDGNAISAGTVLGTDPLDKKLSQARPQLSSHRRGQCYSRTLYDLARDTARIGHADR